MRKVVFAVLILFLVGILYHSFTRVRDTETELPGPAIPELSKEESLRRYHQAQYDDSVALSIARPDLYRSLLKGDSCLQMGDTIEALRIYRDVGGNEVIGTYIQREALRRIDQPMVFNYLMEHVDDL